MKKTLSGLLAGLMVLSLSAGFLIAGDNERGIVGAGPGGGFSLANNCGGEETTSFKLGMAFGAFLLYRFNSRLSFEANMLLTQKGSRYSVTDAYGDYTSSLTLCYLEFPILVRMHLAAAGAASLYAFGGVSPAFKTGGKYNYEYSGIYEGMSGEGDVDDYKCFDLGLVVGGGIGLPFCQRDMALIKLLLVFGLLKTNPCEDHCITNTAIMLSFWYMFGF